MLLAAFDYSNLLIRHALNPYSSTQDTQGREVSGVLGAVRQIERICSELAPTHVLIARDDSRSNLKRKESDQDYKSHRPKGNDDIKYQFELSWQVLELLDLPVVMAAGYEADDVLATAATEFTDRSVVVTGDKDLLALCDDPSIQVRLLRTGGHIDCGPQQCHELTSVVPEKLRDYKALAGDSSDGIPGVPGIGKKRALALLDEYGTLDRILSAALPLQGVTQAVSDKIDQNRALAQTSYELAALHRDLEGIKVVRYNRPPTSSELSSELQQLGVGAIRKSESRPLFAPIEV